MTISIHTRADDLAQIFARRVTEAAAQALDVEPAVMLAAAGARGRPSDPAVTATRKAFAELAARCFPCVSDPARTLLRMCRGETKPRPLWEHLAGLEVGLAVKASTLLDGPAPE